MERQTEKRSGDLSLPREQSEETSGRFGTHVARIQPMWRGEMSASCAPVDITQTCATNDLASFKVLEMETAAVVVASGEIDISTAPALHEALLSASRASARVVLDLAEVTFLDSSGLAVLIDAIESGDQGREASPRLVHPTPPVRRVLDITRLSQKMPIHETLAEALDPGI